MTHRPTTPAPPAAWVVIQDYHFSNARSGLSTTRKVIAAFPRPDDRDLQDLVEKEKANSPGAIAVEPDHPGLAVTHYGIRIQSPCWLTCRDIWFQRHASILEPHLRDPQVARVLTFSPGEVHDPLISHKSSATGPFAFPRGAAWPMCRLCHSRMAFLGALDFRDFRAVPVPRGALVLHACQNCGVVADPEAWTLTWIKEGEPVQILGDGRQQVLVGTPWSATEYPRPADYPKGLTDCGYFLDEDSIYLNFSCFADKIGGHVFRIQGHYVDDAPPTDSRGHPMIYIGQFIGSPDVEIGDGGIAYLYYSPTTEETVMYPEWF
jgi:hypothetical protein